MKFEYDSKKDAINKAKHGISLAKGKAIFLDENRLTAVDDRQDYQETRYATLGLIEGRLYMVVYTERADTIRLISVRKANKREQNRYDND